jgi:hypothetical protein
MPTLRCEECGRKADDDAAGWRTYLAHEPGSDREPFLVTYCRWCARREFDDPPDERASL